MPKYRWHQNLRTPDHRASHTRTVILLLKRELTISEAVNLMANYLPGNVQSGNTFNFRAQELDKDPQLQGYVGTTWVEQPGRRIELRCRAFVLWK
jgi:hypothetical protein